jgi:hypothetical protein
VVTTLRRRFSAKPPRRVLLPLRRLNLLDLLRLTGEGDTRWAAKAKERGWMRLKRRMKRRRMKRRWW